jgi:drug/metabolite transporter (DMT)-like permease
VTILSLWGSLLIVAEVSLSLEFNGLVSISMTAFLGFAIIGVIYFPLGRYFKYAGIKYVGVARSVTLRSCSPLFATILAALLLGERPSLLIIVGNVSVVGGVPIVVSEGGMKRRVPG